MTSTVPPQLDRFFVEATRFCDAMEREPSSEADGFREIHVLLVDLHVAALQLPDLDGEDDAPDVRVDQSAIRRSRLSGPLGTFYYDIFEPLAEPPETYVGNSIAGDLGDIYGDLKEGLVLWELGYWRAACWQWRFLYYMHWGEHLVGALRACYWVVRTHPDLA